MKRLGVICALAAGLAASSGEAGAQALYNQPGGYGGGFIELLMTGRDPASQERRRGLSADPFNPGQAAPGAGSRGAFAEPASPQAAPAMRLRREVVAFEGRQAPGTIVIDTPSKYLYLVQPGGQALRYGIGVGRPGFTWSGTKTITAKREWPDWTPPSEMLKRRPDLPHHMEGGPANPLGARAMYLGSTLYRIHGTNEPNTIGTNVSSGCIRMMNEDVVDLYERVRVGTKVLVI